MLSEADQDDSISSHTSSVVRDDLVGKTSDLMIRDVVARPKITQAFKFVEARKAGTGERSFFEHLEVGRTQHVGVT